MKKKQKESDQLKKDELARCKRDIMYFAENYLTVKDKRTNKVRKLNFVELQMLKQFTDMNAKRHLSYIF